MNRYQYTSCLGISVNFFIPCAKCQVKTPAHSVSPLQRRASVANRCKKLFPTILTLAAGDRQAGQGADRQTNRLADALQAAVFTGLKSQGGRLCTALARACVSVCERESYCLYIRLYVCVCNVCVHVCVIRVVQTLLSSGVWDETERTIYHHETLSGLLNTHTHTHTHTHTCTYRETSTYIHSSYRGTLSLLSVILRTPHTHILI